LLYNTGARIQEALNLSPNVFRWESPFHVRLLGKGRKERICPLWPETIELLKAFLKRKPRREDEPIFVNRYGHPLKAAGVRFKLRQYVAGCKEDALPCQETSLPTFLSARNSNESYNSRG
jgi:integrase